MADGHSTSVLASSIEGILRERAAHLADAAAFQAERRSRINKRNTFTDAHLAIEAKVLAWLSDDRPPQKPTCVLLGLAKGAPTALNRRSLDRARSVAGELNSDITSPVSTESHEFVTYYALRLLGAHSLDVPAKAVARVQSSVMRQIAHHSAGAAARFDLGALVFGVAILQQSGPANEPLVARGLEIILQSQAPDGSWPEVRTIYHDGKTLFISSYEIALTLANLVLTRLRAVGPASCAATIDALTRTLTLARTERRAPTDREAGWGNDRNPAPDAVESWTTAVVCSFAVRLNQVVSMRHRLECIRLYSDASSTESTVDSLGWPDLDDHCRVATRREIIRRQTKGVVWRGAALRVSDPTTEGGIADVLSEEFIRPILFDWAERPAEHGVSLLLPGDPGTRKTSLVKELARVIGWPVITLTPPIFLREGLERFESEAAAIFRDLQELDRVIIFFDECEEFFRARKDSNVSVESRTSGAFITAGMLPRLQALHDRRSVLFVVATNAKASELDPAAIRPGRFDRRFDMLHPEFAAQKRYLTTTLTEKFEKANRPVPGGVTIGESVRAAVHRLRELVNQMEVSGVGGQGVPFNVLDAFRDGWSEGSPPDAASFAADVRRSRGEEGNADRSVVVGPAPTTDEIQREIDRLQTLLRVVART